MESAVQELATQPSRESIRQSIMLRRLTRFESARCMYNL